MNLSTICMNSSIVRHTTTLCFKYRKIQCTASCLSDVLLLLSNVFISMKRMSDRFITCRSGNPALRPIFFRCPPVLAFRLPSFGIETIAPNPRFSYLYLNQSTQDFCNLPSAPIYNLFNEKPFSLANNGCDSM